MLLALLTVLLAWLCHNQLADRVHSLNTHKNGSARRIKVKIDGPHGSLSLPKPVTRYKAAILFAGGVGITPMMSVLCSLIATNEGLSLSLSPSFLLLKLCDFCAFLWAL